MVYALTGDPAEAQDIAQEAYARAWERWRAISTYDDPQAWVLTVARRIASSRWRKARNRLVAHRRHGAAAPVDPPNDDTVLLVGALRQIPTAQREAVVLHHIVGLPVDEVARQLGVPVGTVKTRLVRGRQALSRLLDTDVTEVSHA